MSCPEFCFVLTDAAMEDDSFIPQRGEPTATGWDVRAALPQGQQIIVKPGQHLKIPIGVKAFCPKGWWLELRPRSSSFAKKNLHALYGVIDQDYHGDIMFACQYLPDGTAEAKDLVITHGEKLGQLIPVKLQEMSVKHVSNQQYEDMCAARGGARGAGGFGSTDGAGGEGGGASSATSAWFQQEPHKSQLAEAIKWAAQHPLHLQQDGQQEVWTVEPHGKGLGLYAGRTHMQHGHRLLNLEDGDINFSSHVRLITAAPALLAACKAALFDGNCESSTIDILKAAINKATQDMSGGFIKHGKE